MSTIFLFSAKGYSFFAQTCADDDGCFYEVCLDKAGEDYIGVSADTLREARAAAKEWLAEQGC